MASWRTACGEEFFIYEVDYALTKPEMRIIQDPIGKDVPAKESVIEYRITPSPPSGSRTCEPVEAPA